MKCIQRAAEIMGSIENVTLALFDEDGYPSASTVSVIQTDGVYHVWFSTGLASSKASRIKANNKASVCFQDGTNNVSLVGTIEIITDQQVKTDLWQDWFINHFPDGHTDSNYCVLQFTTNRLSLWVDQKSDSIPISDINQPQSRCGILCDFCSYKQSHGCEGCLHIDNPFWGECPVKTCCESKGLTHCGECPDIPCEPLHEFSCADGEHCDKPKGLRIEHCKTWAK